LILPIIFYTLSTPNLQIMAKEFRWIARGWGEEGVGRVVREEVEEGVRNDLNIVCTYE
jgi:hypothetical protein